MAKFRDSQCQMLEHSEVKVTLLKEYLKGYLSVLSQSRYTNDVYIFDLFCGKGIYDNGGKGSPVIILETINSIDAKNTKFHCHFNDQDKDKINELKNVIHDQKMKSDKVTSLNFTTEKYQSLLPSIVEKLNGLSSDKAFIFIDPYGYSEIKWDDIKSLLQHKNSEVLLFMPTQFMFRFSDKAQPECLKVFISELIPEEGWPKCDTGIEFIETLTKKFRNGLGKEFYVDRFFITRRTNQFFCLFFFTSHIKGFEKMLEAKWEIDSEEGRGWRYQQENSLFPDLPNSPHISSFESNLLEFLNQPKSNSEVYKFTLKNGFLPKHANQILKKYQKSGTITVRAQDMSVPRQGAFYLNYKPDKEVIIERI